MTTTSRMPSGMISADTILVDTSALYALLSATDEHHVLAASYWAASRDVSFATHGYIVAESIALVRKRLGWPAVRQLIEALLPRIDVHMVDRALYDQALVTYLGEGGGTGFVDRVSIEFARREGIRRAFAFDADLAAAGLSGPVSEGGERP